MTISQKINLVRSQIAAAAQRAGRSASAVEIVGVSKYVDAAAAQEAVDAGLENLGENRTDMLLEKRAAVRGARWHMIGHLQTNKVASVIGKTELIHSVDSLRLAEAIEKECSKRGVSSSILLEVNISEEKSKFGLTTAELSYIINRIKSMEFVRLRGIMTMAPLTDNPETSRPIFREAKRIFDSYEGFDCLSMGMSGDFAVAVEEGATLVRIGSAIFK